VVRLRDRASFSNATREHEPSHAERLRLHSRPQNDADDRVERLFEDYAGRVYRYCLSRLGSPEEAEDALQATYLNAWRSLRSGVRPISTRPWLFQIASNVCSSVLRKRLNGGTVELRTPEALDQMPMRSEPTDELLGLSAALERLPERQRHALLLRDWRGLTYDEIATELNSSYEAVETLLFRARKAVAAGLTKPEPARTPLARTPVRARALTPLPFLLPLHHGWSAFKSTLSSSIAPTKVSLGIALGAAAPLVAFGLLQGGLQERSAPPAKAAAPAVQLDSLTAPKLPPLVVPVVTPSKKSARPAPAKARKHSASHPTASGSSESPSSGGASGATPDLSLPDVPLPDLSPPDPPAQIPDIPVPDTVPPPDTALPPKVTICHHTGSANNPGVTISIAAAAVDAHLALGDELGACSG
jgi:RNA polymerase sigma-70 factor (ECF subfamily)